MDMIGSLPFFPLEITKDGKVFDPAQKAAIETAVHAGGADKLTDLIVISHGWNNDKADARLLYNGLLNRVSAQLAGHNALATRKFAVIGIFWPSKKFADSELIPSGGAASLGGGDLAASALLQKLDSLTDVFDNAEAPQLLERAKALVNNIENSPDQQDEFVKIIRSLVPQTPSDTTDDASDKFLNKPPSGMLKALGVPVMQLPTAGTGGHSLGLGNVAAGGAAAFGDFFNGVKAGAWRLLNYATYYQMKERAGVVGTAVNGVLGSVRNLRSDLRLHLIGHSFGARVVTAAVDGPAASSRRA